MHLKRSIFSFFLMIFLMASWLYYIGGEFGKRATVPPITSAFSDLTDTYAWAKESIEDLVSKEILSGMNETTFAPAENVTREQFAKILVTAFKLPLITDKMQVFEDIPTSRWSFAYTKTAKYLMDINEPRFQPTKVVTREEAASSIIKALGLANENIANPNALSENFSDSALVAPTFEKLVSIAFQNNLIGGIDGQLLPFNPIRRAEMAVMLYRALKLNVKIPILGKTETTIEAAKEWAKSRDADQSFIDIADLYWKFGEQIGIRPEVLYAQAAKETKFGKFTGNVRSDMNNWAGIKKVDGTGDTTDAHESFTTPEAGVIAHFNHMAAYVGVQPIGTPHGRYSVVMSQPWAGTIKNVEELGGKWAPDLEYGNSIKNDYLLDLMSIQK